MKPWKTALALLGVGVLLFLLVTMRGGSRQEQPYEQAPALELLDLKGRKVSLTEFKGKVVLLDFWATWCDPCLEELPDIKALHEKYKDRGFTVLGVSLDVRGKKAVGPFVRENNVPYPVLLTDGTPPDGYPVIGIPAAFLIDRQGRIVRQYLGPKSYDEVAKDVEERLAL